MNDQETIRVLHVDDEPGFADLTANFLQREDDRMDIETATSVSEGLDKLDETQVDCIVSDFDMPARNGLDFLRTVRNADSDIPFILFTGQGSEEVASDAFRAGASDYLKKEKGTDQFEVLANRIRTLVSARRAASEAQRRRHRQEQIHSTVPACIVRINPDGEFVYANDRAEDVLGLEPAEVAHRSYNDPAWNITDLDGNPIPDEELPFRQVLESGEPVHGCRHTIQWPDGSRKVLHVNGAPLFDNDGTIESTLFALTDITDAIHRQEELERLKDRYEAFVEHSEDILTVVDEAGEIRYQSPAIECVLGYEPGELVGEHVFDYFHPDDRERAIEAFYELVEAPHEAMDRIEHRFQRADGSWVWLESVGGNRTNSALDGYVVNSRDITNRKEREDELGRERERLWAIFETVPFPIAHVRLVDGRNIVEQVNPAFADVFGYDTDYLKGRCLNDVIVPEERREQAQEIDEGVSDTAFIEREVTRKTIDGPRDFLFRARELAIDIDCEGREALGVYIDITERRQREQQIERQNERLEEFASVVSHDLRNPLTVAEGQLELARQDADSEHLEIADQALERMRGLIDDLLELARTGDRLGELEWVDLAVLANTCWELVETGRATLDIDTDHVVRADESRVRQLLENLLRNAIEHGGGDVSVTLGSTDAGFYVEDDGAGFDEATLKSVAGTGELTADDGPGIGLKVVHEVADAHGWTVTVSEGTDGGARIDITDVTIDDARAPEPSSREFRSVD